MCAKLLSIIVPAYNVERYIVQCLDSIFESFSGKYAGMVEVIVVNDGSTDATLNILQKYMQKVDFILIDKHNEGLSAARNVGINVSHGEYVYFVDSDDYVLPTMLQAVIEFLLMHAELDILCFDMYFLSEVMQLSENVDAPTSFAYEFGTGQLQFIKWTDNMVFSNSACTKIFKKNLIIDHKVFFCENILFEDVEWMPRIFSYADCVVYIPVYAYVYRMRRNSITHSDMTEKLLADYLKICDSLVAFSTSQHLSKEFVQALLRTVSCVYWRILNGIRLNGRYNKQLISALKDRAFLMEYSTKFNRKYIYRNFINIFGVKAFYTMRHLKEILTH